MTKQDTARAERDRRSNMATLGQYIAHCPACRCPVGLDELGSNGFERTWRGRCSVCGRLVALAATIEGRHEA